MNRAINTVERFPFRCSACKELILAPANLEGVTQSCPECAKVVTWGPPEGTSPQEPISGTNVTCLALSAGAFVTLLLPFVWILAIPMAVVSAMLGINAIRTYRATVGVWIAVVVSVLVLIGGLVGVVEVNEMLQRLGQG